MKEPIQIVRIEHPGDGRGLWRSLYNGHSIIDKHSQYEIISERHGDSLKFPNYISDGFLRNQICWDRLQDYHFAFLSLDQLATALTNEELKECINKLGFRVLMLTVTDYYKSSFQVVYKKESIIKQDDISFMFL